MTLTHSSTAFHGAETHCDCTNRALERVERLRPCLPADALEPRTSTGRLTSES
jgi:hypothetical protein